MASPWRLLLDIRSFSRCETQPPLSYSSLKVQLWDGCLLSGLAHTEICKQSPLWQLPLPTTCPWHAERSPKSHIPPKKWKCQPRRIHAFHDEIPVMAGKQTSWSAGSFPDFCPCRTWNSSSPNQLSITNAYTHTKTTCLQKHISKNKAEHLKTNQLTRNMSNRNSYSLLKRCLDMDNRRDIWTNTVLQRIMLMVFGQQRLLSGYKGMLEALPAESGAMLCHFSGRWHLWELLFELPSHMWTPSPIYTQATQVLWIAFPKHTVLINEEWSFSSCSP